MEEQNTDLREQNSSQPHWNVNFGQPQDQELSMQNSAVEMKRIYTLLDRLKRKSEVRRIAEELLTTSPIHIPSLTPVIRPLIRPNRSRSAERQVASWILGTARLDAQQRQFAVDTLIKLLEGKLNPDASELMRKAMWRSAIAVGLLAIMTADHIDGDVPYPVILVSFFCAFAPLTWLLTLYHNRLTASQVASEAARSLGHLQATEALDALVAAAQNNRRVRPAALEALPPVLATIQDSHYGHIRSETMQGLSRLLNMGNETLALAVVNALYHVGDAAVVGQIEKLAAGEGRAARESRIQQAAIAALPRIQDRIARARDPHQLLRGSSIPHAPTEQLLRPSIEINPTDPFELLRASTDPDWKGTETEISFIVRVLEDLSHKGDINALPYVERIAANRGADGRIIEAAIRCLPTLRAHHELHTYCTIQVPDQTETNPNLLGLGTHL